MRLAPDTRPRSLLVRLAYVVSRRRYGRVLAPLSTLYARMPRLLRPQVGLLRLASAGLGLEPGLRHLVEVHVSRLNGCAFCGDLHRFEARAAGLEVERFDALPGHRSSDRFTAGEKAALGFAEELVAHKRASDGAWEGVCRHFGERGAAELVWLVTFTCYLNGLAAALELSSAGLCPLPAPAVGTSTPARPVGGAG